MAPLIKNQVSNNVEVTNVLAELKSASERHEDLIRQIEGVSKELLALPGINERIREIEDTARSEKRQQKAMNEQFAEKIDRVRDRANTMMKDIQRAFNEIDNKGSLIKSNQELMQAYRERSNQELTAFVKQITGELDMFMVKTNKAS